jgi:hypothetical protein
LDEKKGDGWRNEMGKRNVYTVVRERREVGKKRIGVFDEDA